MNGNGVGTISERTKQTVEQITAAQQFTFWHESPPELHADFSNGGCWLLLAEGHLNRGRFGAMLRSIVTLPEPIG
jgi:hypothetical protein